MQEPEGPAGYVDVCRDDPLLAVLNEVADRILHRLKLAWWNKKLGVGKAALTV